jgi:ABC-type transport system substrate-binding protein
MKKMKKMKKIVAFVLLGVFLFSFVGYGKNSSSKTSSIGMSTDVTAVPAWRLRSYQDAAVWSAVYEPLFRMSSKGKVVSYLAKSITANPGKLTYTITLRKDVCFSDGSKLNADVLLWNFQNFKANSQTSNTHFGDVASFEKKDDSTVVIHMSNWSSQIPYSLTNVAGLMYSKKAFDDNGADWAASHPVGTGPYVLDSWVKDDHITLKKNPNYWKKHAAAALDKITFKVISDEMSALAALQSKEIAGYFNGSFDMMNTAKTQGFSTESASSYWRIIFLIFGSDVKGSPLCDVRVRQAIAYAIDSNAIAKNLDHNISWNSKEYAIKNTIFWNAAVKGYGYDVNKAKKLLAKAGYPNGFTTKLSTGVDQALNRYMIAIQGYLAAVGIKVDLDYQQTAVWTSTGIYQTDGGMILAGHGFGYNLVNQMASNFSKRAVQGVGMLKKSAIHPDDLDAVIMKALRAKDTATMLKNVKEAQSMIIDKYCLGYPVVISAITNLIHSSDLIDQGCFNGSDSYGDWNKVHTAK